MGYLDSYLDRIISRGNIQLAESVKHTATDIASKYLENFSFCDDEVGLLFGNVQSGKTGQMFGVICVAADLGFPVFFLLTTDNVVLQQQTLTRVQNDLPEFCICGEYDTEVFAENSLMKPTIVVLKKNFRVLQQWSNIVASTGFMRGNPLFILDDEADAASLNTLVNRNGQSSINKYLDEIKERSSCSIYLQVTGTPQALFLQSISSGWHPNFSYYFAPGKGYLGGDFFFPKNGKADCVTYIDELENPLEEAILHHIVVSAEIMYGGGKVCNMMVHPSVRKAAHKSFESRAKKILEQLQSAVANGEYKAKLLHSYALIEKQGAHLHSFDQLFPACIELLSTEKIIVMNGSTDVSADQYDSGSNIIIGGNTLGRGVTFPRLQTIYYSRTAKKPQADTMWQHSRMFGYDRTPELMQVFIEEKLLKLFADINATNNSIISQIANAPDGNVEHIKVYLPEGLAPTRKNVLDTNKLLLITGGTNYYPFYPDNNTIEQLDLLLQRFSESEPYYQVSLKLMLEIFSHIISAGNDFVIANYTSAITSIIREAPTAQGILIVRRNRDVAQGTGALLSPNDWELGGRFQDKVVLTCYKVTGKKGWGGKELWVPNIKFPEGMVYYDVVEEDSSE